MVNQMKCTKQIILGSASPRRRELLQQIGLDFTVVTSDIEEKITSVVPAQIVQELSLQKAISVFGKVCGTKYIQSGLAEVQRLQISDKKDALDATDILVIGADTIVAFKDTVLGKPHSKENAFFMLKGLQGKIHQVYTSVSLVWAEAGRVQTHTFYEKTDVEVMPMTDREIAYYVSLDTCMDKAGAYGIQNEFACFVKGISGDYNNVVGLPVGRLYQELQKMGFLKIQTSEDET